MLKIPTLDYNDEVNSILRKFVNDRLISIMKDAITEEAVKILEYRGLGGRMVPCWDENWEYIDIIALMDDSEFVEALNVLYLPPNFPIERTYKVFMGLFNLLKAKDEYVPELVMEYILDKVINYRIESIEAYQKYISDGISNGAIGYTDIIRKESELIDTVKRIPKAERQIVKDYFMNTMVNGADCDECETQDECAESYIDLYENLKNYSETCFWDMDFALLDQMTEDEIANSPINDYMGIIDKKETKKMNFSVDGNNGKQIKIKADLELYPWDMEED